MRGFKLYQEALNNHNSLENLEQFRKHEDTNIEQISKILASNDWYGGEFLEQLAQLGDPHEVPYAIPMIKDSSTDMSYTGFWATVLASLKRQGEMLNGPKSPEQFQYLADVAASAQHKAFMQVDVKIRRAFETMAKMKIPLKYVNLAGGWAGNHVLHEIIQKVWTDYEVPMIKPDARYIQDNPVSVAWMGCEYINANSATDIRSKNIQALANIPLGNYADIVPASYKNTNKFRKIGTRKQRQQSGIE